MPMVAVRSMGLSLESIIGELGEDGKCVCKVSEEELRELVEIGNSRFGENEKRIARFRELLKGKEERKGEDGGVWEDAKTRGERTYWWLRAAS